MSFAHRYKLDLARVEKMAELGMLPDDSHIELLDGDLVEMSLQGPLHSSHVTLLAGLLRSTYPAATTRDSKPLVCDPYNAPEPDLAVVYGGPYTLRHARANESILVLEVAVTSLDIDVKKQVIYARGGAPVYWLLDIPGRCLRIYTHPGANGYTEETILRAEPILPGMKALPEEVTFPGTTERVMVETLLPPRNS